MHKVCQHLYFGIPVETLIGSTCWVICWGTWRRAMQTHSVFQRKARSAQARRNACSAISLFRTVLGFAVGAPQHVPFLCMLVGRALVGVRTRVGQP